MRADVIDQILAMALHTAYDCQTAIVSMEVILNLTQSPETHSYIVRREVMEKVLEIHEQRYKMVIQEQSLQTQQGKKEDLNVVNALKYVILPTLTHTMSCMQIHNVHVYMYHDHVFNSTQVLY